MSTSKGRIYNLFTGLTVLGYSWIILNIYFGQDVQQVVCPIKLLTGFPCPSCGTTRSVISMFKGNIHSAVYSNPLGLLMFTFILIFPFWLIYDFVLKKDTLWKMYGKIETFISQKSIAIPLILLVIANWIWNIIKEI